MLSKRTAPRQGGESASWLVADDLERLAAGGLATNAVVLELILTAHQHGTVLVERYGAAKIGQRIPIRLHLHLGWNIAAGKAQSRLLGLPQMGQRAMQQS